MPGVFVWVTDSAEKTYKIKICRLASNYLYYNYIQAVYVVYNTLRSFICMNLHKMAVVFCLIGLPMISAGQIYRAGTDKTVAPADRKRGDISVGVYHAAGQLVDPVDEKLLSGEAGVSVRGLYYLTPWLAGGLDGTFSQKKSFPIQNSYRHISYGVITKWLLTPHTQPRLYLLAGGGMNRRKLSYAGMWGHTVSKPYLTIGPGIELDVSSWGYVGLEMQGRYNTCRRLDDFTALKSRWEMLFALRGGIRF